MAKDLKIGNKQGQGMDDSDAEHTNHEPAPLVADQTFGVIRAQGPIAPDIIQDAFMEAAIERDERSKQSSR